MKDSDFKALKLCCDDFDLYTHGTAIQKVTTLTVSLNGRMSVIIEHETELNRKTIIADIFKGASFLQEKKVGN